MKHRTLDQVKAEAKVTAAEPEVRFSARELRRARLEQLAIVLERHKGPVRPFSRIEYIPRSESEELRSDMSPLSIAYQDATLRGAGLAGDRLGDGIAFFHLSWGQAHKLLCDCHYHGMVTPQMVAARARSIARQRTFGDIWAKVQSACGF